MGQRITALRQEFERVVEAGRVRLPLVGDRPKLADVVAEQLRIDRRLTRRHPVDVAAQRVDLAVVGDHPERVRKPPRREGVGREALVDEGERAREARVRQVAVIGADLIGEEHALVDDGARRQRHDVEVGADRIGFGVNPVRDDLADEVELALEILVAGARDRALDEDLPMSRFGRHDVRGLGERGVIDRHLAPAEHGAAFLRCRGLEQRLEMQTARLVLRHEDEADAVLAGLRQRHVLRRHLFREEGMRDLDKHARPVAHQRVGPHRTAMGEVLEDLQPLLDDRVGLLVLHMRDEADAAGVVLVLRVVEPDLARRGARLDRGARLNGGGWRVDRHRVALLCPAPMSLPDMKTATCRRFSHPPSSGTREITAAMLT